MPTTITTILVYITVASLLLTINDVSKLKKENTKLKGEIEIIKKKLSEK